MTKLDTDLNIIAVWCNHSTNTVLQQKVGNTNTSGLPDLNGIPRTNGGCSDPSYLSGPFQLWDIIVNILGIPCWVGTGSGCSCGGTSGRRGRIGAGYLGNAGKI